MLLFGLPSDHYCGLIRIAKQDFHNDRHPWDENSGITSCRVSWCCRFVAEVGGEKIAFVLYEKSDSICKHQFFPISATIFSEAIYPFKRRVVLLCNIILWSAESKDRRIDHSQILKHHQTMIAKNRRTEPRKICRSLQIQSIAAFIPPLHVHILEHQPSDDDRERGFWKAPSGGEEGGPRDYLSWGAPAERKQESDLEEGVAG